VVTRSCYRIHNKWSLSFVDLLEERHLLTMILSKISLYHQMFSFLFDGLSMTGYPQSLIFLSVVVYIIIPCYVLLDAMLLRIYIHNLFMHCPIFGVVWSGMISWLKITWICPDKAISMASQFCGTHGFFKKFSISLQAI
jgi:hypothetical protein